MKFDWVDFTETDYNKYIEKCVAKIFDSHDYLGVVRIGDICIELIDSDWFGANDEYDELEHILMFNFYVAHEDTGYGYKDDGMPYDYADGFDMTEMPYNLSYEEFKAKAEKLFMEYIEAYNGDYSLVEHANKPLEAW